MNRLPAYVRALSNDDLIWNRLKERGHRFRRSLGVSVFGCFEFAVLVNRLRTADRSEVARCLRLIALAVRHKDRGSSIPRTLPSVPVPGEESGSATPDPMELRKPAGGDRLVHQVRGRRRERYCLTSRAVCSQSLARTATAPL